jgi:hypothetical protein
VLFSINSQANTGLSCYTPTTSISISPDINSVKVNFVRPWGARYNPIYHGSVAPIQLKALLKQSELLSKFPNNLSFDFPMKNCEFEDKELIICRSGKSINIAGHEVTPATLRTSIVTTKDIDYKFDKIIINLALVIDGEMHNLAMDYEFNRCK